MLRRAALTALLLLTGWIAPPRASAAAAETTSGPLRVAVLDLSASVAPAELAASLTGLVASELTRLGIFDVISREEIRQMLSLERQRQALGCDSGGCVIELGGALGARYLVGGSVSLVGGRYVLTIALSDVEQANVVGRASESTEDVAQLVTLAGRAVRLMAEPLLRERLGSLLLRCAEHGATVKVDGRIVGTTPLPRSAIPYGPHRLEVEKAGFITAAEDVTIQGSGTLERQITLLPSPDFLEAYETNARRWRLGAWLSTAAAVGGALTAGWFQLEHLRQLDRYEAALPAYKAGGLLEAQHAELQATLQKAGDDLFAAQLSAALSATLGAAAVTFWIVGPDPDRYAPLRGLMEPSARPMSLQLLSPAGLVALSGVLP